jgi:hypothetical protein
MPRTRTLWTESILHCVTISICMAPSAEFRSSNNDKRAGARGAFASIFLYSMRYTIFFNAMIWVVLSTGQGYGSRCGYRGDRGNCFVTNDSISYF